MRRTQVGFTVGALMIDLGNWATALDLSRRQMIDGDHAAARGELEQVSREMRQLVADLQELNGAQRPASQAAAALREAVQDPAPRRWWSLWR